MTKSNDNDLKPLYDAAERFVENALTRQDSLFTPGKPIWCDPTIQDLYRRFVEQPDESSASFEEKLEKQLAGGPADTYQLAAELLYVHLLGGNSTGGNRKREIINTVLARSPSPVAMPAELAKALNKGLAAEGVAFRTFRPFLLAYLLEFARRWWSLSDEERSQGLKDPWAFKKIAFSTPRSKAQSQAEILLHLVHPESFEDIMSQDHKKKIAKAFESLVKEPTDDVDQRLLQIRGQLTEQFGPDVSFYGPQLVTKWQHKHDSTGATLASYTYTLGTAGNRTGVVESNGRTVAYDYDNLYRLTRETVTMAGATEWLFEYGYDKVGNRTNMRVMGDGAQADVEYHYDARDRLISEVRSTTALAWGPDRDDGTRYSSAPAKPSPWAGYGLLGLLAVTLAACSVPLWSSSNRTRHAKWRACPADGPPLGRRASRRRKFITTLTLLLVPLMAVGPETVLALNQEALLYHAGFGAALGPTEPGLVLIDYVYDDNGNLVEKAERFKPVIRYSYDAENRLVKVDPGVGPTGVVTYAYDADGIRVAKTVGTARTSYLVDKNRDYAQVLEERNGEGDLVVRYLYGQDLIAQTRGGQTRYYHYDGQMSTRLLTNSQGTVTDTYTYDAFGIELVFTGSTVNNYLYTGEQWDPNAGFYYLRARYHDQSVGRFISRDSFEGFSSDPITLHKYLYAHANPVNGIDPSGKWFTLGGALLTAGISGLLAGVFIGSYGYAKGWSAWEIGKATSYAFLVGAAAGALVYGAVWSLAAGAVASGVTAEAAAAVAWTAAGLILTPTSLGLAIRQFKEARERGDQVDQVFAGVNLALAAGSFFLVRFAAINLPAKVPPQYSAPVQRVGQGIIDWLGKGWKSVRDDPEGFVAISADNTRKFRIDFWDSRGDKPHTHLQIKNANGSWADATPQHRLYLR